MKSSFFQFLFVLVALVASIHSHSAPESTINLRRDSPPQSHHANPPSANNEEEFQQIINLLSRYKNGEQVSLADAPASALRAVIRKLETAAHDGTLASAVCHNDAPPTQSSTSSSKQQHHNMSRRDYCDDCWNKCYYVLGIGCLSCYIIGC